MLKFKLDTFFSRGPFVSALDKTWCPDHFICTNPQCSCPLIGIGFVEEDGQLFCERDYEQYFAPRCGKCGCAIMRVCFVTKKITDRICIFFMFGVANIVTNKGLKRANACKIVSWYYHLNHYKVTADWPTHESNKCTAVAAQGCSLEKGYHIFADMPILAFADTPMFPIPIPVSVHP